MKRLSTFFLILLGLFLITCNNDSNITDGDWTFKITYTPTSGQPWFEEGTATATEKDGVITAEVTMLTGEKYTRTFTLDGEKVIALGSYTQPVASEPDKNEIVTYDGEGTFDGKDMNVTGTYTFNIPDMSYSEEGTFVLDGSKK